jgi:Polyketide cyclase / dehydrase and lipid transport
MAGFARSIVIEVTPAVAFDYLADPSTATVIDPAVIHYRPDHVPMDVGTRIDIKARLAGLRLRFESLVAVWEPGARMVMRSVSPARPIDVVAEHRFEADPCGTRYTWSAAATSNTPGGAVVAWLFCTLMRRNAARQQERLKSVLESPRR